jgi:hypothetical protein
MKINLLKGFAAVAMLCMVGAAFATPVALGDIGAYVIITEQNYDGGSSTGEFGLGVASTGAAVFTYASTAELSAAAALTISTGGAALVGLGVALVL